MRHITLFLLLLPWVLFGNTTLVIDKDLNNHYITIADKSYKVLEFKKRISTIKISDSEKISMEFVEGSSPLQSIKVFAMSIGNANALVTFDDKTTTHINFNIVNDLKSIINLVEIAYPGVKITQVGDNIVLKGNINSTKDKKKILEILKKANVDIDNKVIDTVHVDKPENMIRIKLYAVEINNNKGVTLKNNWLISSKNFTEVETTDGLYYNTKSSDQDSSNAQRMIEVNHAVNSLMQNAVSLSGGLTGAANYLGDLFNVGWTLQYLKTNGVARVLDETTLITTEGKDADFHAGGYITVKTSTTSKDGVPVTELKEINYGLRLNFNVEEIINSEYVSININTEQSDADWSNTVDNIPAITTKSVKTNVISKNKSTIVLGGLVQRDQSQSIEKIPLLGDIPIIGRLFTSEAFQRGDSELVFFITPEIVNTQTNQQANLLNNIQNDINDLNQEYDEDKDDESIEEESEKENLSSSTSPSIDEPKIH